MVFYAIQWGLVVAAALSSITAVSGVVNTQGTMERFFGGNFPTDALSAWNMRMLFMSLLVAYALNVVVAVWMPFSGLAYTLAVGNMIRVGFVLRYILDAEKIGLMGMAENGRMLKIICALQTVLAVAICTCTYVSSTDEDYTSYSDELAAAADGADLGAFAYFVYAFCAIGILGRIAQVVNVRTGMARFMVNGEADLPSDKGVYTINEFTFGFAAVNFLTIWSFVIALTFFAASSTPLAALLVGVCVFFMPMMMRTIIDLPALKFALPPMLFFVALICTMFGASLLELLS